MRRAALTSLLTILLTTATTTSLTVTGVAAPAAAAAVAVRSVTSANPAPAARSAAGRDLARRLSRAFRRSTAGVVDWRFDVSGLGSLRHQASRMTPPASNNKLLVAQTALDRLGPEAEFGTKVGARGGVVGHTLSGHLVIRASGDPTLGYPGMLDLARQVRSSGIRRVTGGLIVDDSRYVHRTQAPGWHAGFVPHETGPIDSFAYDENWWKTGSDFIAHTGLVNGRKFVSVLRHHGVRVTPKVRLGSYTHVEPVAVTYSQPLAAIVTDMLTRSDNFEAEMLLDELGAVVTGQGRRTSGSAVIRQESRRLHARIGSVNDGSGLSYADRESPNTLVGWLRATAASSTGGVVRAGLPVACETGTLQHRLCGRWTTGRVFAKTGTLSHITALSGFTTTRSGRAVVFSVLVSRARDLSRAMSRVDAAVTAVASFDR